MKQQVIVVGLGRFGSAAARELHALGHEVLAVDASETVINDIAPKSPTPCRPTHRTSRRYGRWGPINSRSRSWP